MEKVKLLNQSVDYFKNNEGFHRLFVKIKEKYKSLGNIGGTIVFDHLTEEERKAFTGFFRKDFRKRKSAVIKLEQIQHALDMTKFRGIALLDILEQYFEEELIPKKEEKMNHDREKESFFREIIDRFAGTKAGEWLAFVLEQKGKGYRILVQRYNMDKEKLREDLSIVCNAVNGLPFYREKKQRLAVFSSAVSKNPHTFDEGTPCGQLLLHALGYLFHCEMPKNAEERTELLYQAGILKDEVSNYTLCSGLIAYREGKIHGGWEGFYRYGESMQVSLENLSYLDRIISPRGKVFVFENPTVFSEARERMIEKLPPLVCTYGQVKLSSLILLDMLAKEGTQIYYSGDFDPEGLLIADKLKKRYGHQLILWRYARDDYGRAVSSNPIEKKRMRQLKSLQDAKLKKLGQYMEEVGYAGYQELLTDLLVQDISDAFPEGDCLLFL
ncbi:TIGR02679 family protein [Thermotalea metallivorans]|uniref:TIGR02679 family protein n=1 Tax=Thermotalea metallivorans TaxID=520762 RepID=A0A140L4H0_9FIRM|nr:TIGR02679 family protein [Thermotalea metallivorans]KXG75445.1 hypothetical protein AN619_17090 [Thermotalea metallivorans]